MTTEQRTPQHRKPSPATKIRVVALRAAAIGAVAVPAAALSAHELAGEQSAANPMQPADDSTLTQHSAHPAHPATQDPYSPADVQGTLMSLGQEHMLAIEHASVGLLAVAEAKSAAAAVPMEEAADCLDHARSHAEVGRVHGAAGRLAFRDRRAHPRFGRRLHGDLRAQQGPSGAGRRTPDRPLADPARLDAHPPRGRRHVPCRVVVGH